MNRNPTCRAAVLAALLSGALAAFAPAAQAAEPPTAPKKITTIEGITEYQLDNGLHNL